MSEIIIDLGNIENIKLAIQMKDEKDQLPRQITKITFETDAPVRQIARIMHLQKTGVPIISRFQSPQAQFDIKVEQVDTSTGQIHDEG